MGGAVSTSPSTFTYIFTYKDDWRKLYKKAEQAYTSVKSAIEYAESNIPDSEKVRMYHEQRAEFKIACCRARYAIDNLGVTIDGTIDMHTRETEFDAFEPTVTESSYGN